MAVLSIEQHPSLPPVGDALAGALGTVFANICVYPLDVVKTRTQVAKDSEDDTAATSKPKAKSTVAAVLDLIKSPSEAYAGLFGSLIGNASTSMVFFYFHTLFKTHAAKRFSTDGKLSIPADLAVGALAGAIAQIFTIPVNVATTLQQTLPPSRRQDLMATCRTIVQSDGVIGLWKGLGASLVLCVNPAITYGFFEKVRESLYGNTGGKLTPGQAFVVGAISKAIATIVTYPYIMAKVRLQAGAEAANPLVDGTLQEKENAITVLQKVLKRDGLKGWYRGLDAQIYKAVLTQAILFYAKEHFTRYTILMWAMARNMRAKVAAR
ncbi:mitochondrial carrier [Saitoella complicata NRRL Y-17804]|uniref:mitochondrial carrier n=1 Tax=Saitoella complicata (strain BCRC 22490 / CBS 7301 / JCM 7358 / NBRC 10748 / NRRL Y-17804) TaxID=698492 RepID=UPI000866DE32|nr:mitochondrial carrier [Saitoella complicata NRRL Y-17804]ODQ51419.1 mitochondrial carrier [Saitoella complicata NRRL Y-17804]